MVVEKMHMLELKKLLIQLETILKDSKSDLFYKQSIISRLIRFQDLLSADSIEHFKFESITDTITTHNEEIMFLQSGNLEGYNSIKKIVGQISELSKKVKLDLK